MSATGGTSTRATAPLKAAEDAVHIDSSALSIEEVIARAEQIVAEKLKQQRVCNQLSVPILAPADVLLFPFYPPVENSLCAAAKRNTVTKSLFFDSSPLSC